MLKFITLGLISTLAFAAQHPVNDDIVKTIRSKNASWQAADPETNPMSKLSAEQIKGLMGTTIVKSQGMPAPTVLKDLPANFDSRTQWPDCIHPIRDQQHCGSCWAFGASEALSDRFCIASKGAVNVVLSPEDLVSCDWTNMGCNGGMLWTAWEYMEFTGITTDSCFPYGAGSGTPTSCSKTCVNSSEAYKRYQCKFFSVVEGTNPDHIKSEIMANGPMETAFTVYEDFMNYKSGVYQHLTGAELGGHAIKVIGWGHDEATGFDYWICANSWGTSWGLDGFFHIKFGECGIDSGAYACTPKL